MISAVIAVDFAIECVSPDKASIEFKRMVTKTKPKILNTEVIAETSLFQIEAVDLYFSNEVKRRYERVRGRRRGAVMIVPLLDEETVLLVREYAVGLEEYYLSLPKGLLEENEDVNTAANRELQEEVGYGARRIQPLKSLATAPGFIRGKMSIVLAEDLYPSRLEGDEPEALEVVPWKLSELSQLLARDDFCEARSVAALFIVRELMQIKMKK